LPALLLLMQGPRSFTGEDVAELHVPGSLALAAMIQRSLAAAGARHALPGEFTARAFFNQKMDLTQAEGIAATIAAENALQLRAATHLRQGALHQWTSPTAEALAHLLALIEAGIDFAEEEGVSFITPADIRRQLASLQQRIHALLAGALRWERLDTLPTAAIVGRPNVGKSSLINALTGTQRSIVSPIAGTTRDALSAIMDYRGQKIRLLDVAGEEAEMSELASNMNAARRRALEEADLILHVTSLGDGQSSPPTDSASNQIWVINKSDLGNAIGFHRPDAIVSARTGEGIEALRELIATSVLRETTLGTQQMTLNQRHQGLLHSADESLARAATSATDDFVRNFPELLATDLRHALDSIGQISGTISPDEILGRIFGTFCIGK
jgi:tRNA modification GTPase